MSIPGRAAPDDGEDGSVTALELFFDLVFVFGFTQVTGYLLSNLTWTGLVRGAALFAALWWAWSSYAWLTGAVAAEERLQARLVVLTAMAAMLVVALAVPGAFGETALLFGAAYFIVRLLHVGLYAVATPPESSAAMLRSAPGTLGGPALLLVAGFFDGPTEVVLWVVALAIDYGIYFVRGVAGFSVNPAHFVERHRLVLIIALGESIIAIGVGAGGLALTPVVVISALVGLTLIVALWWLYFDFVVLAAEARLRRETGVARAEHARDAYSYVHLLIVGSVIYVALGIEQALAHVGDPLSPIAATALFGGAALYLVGHNAFRYRDYRNLSRPRLVVTALALGGIPLAVTVPALGALALLTALLVGLAAFETIRSPHRGLFRPA